MRAPRDVAAPRDLPAPDDLSPSGHPPERGVAVSGPHVLPPPPPVHVAPLPAPPPPRSVDPFAESAGHGWHAAGTASPPIVPLAAPRPRRVPWRAVVAVTIAAGAAALALGPGIAGLPLPS